jgi:hypothetical protein
MDFITLAAVLDGIVASNLESGDDRATEYSRAAATLHQQIHNNQCPQWVEVNKNTGKPLRNDAVADEGMSILEHMAGWWNRQVEERTRHVIACLTFGLDPDNEPMTINPNGGRYNWRKQKILRETEIGFERTELINFLDTNKIEHHLSQVRKKESPSERRIRITKRYEQLKREGVRGFLKIIAAEEGVCVSRIKQLLQK